MPFLHKGMNVFPKQDWSRQPVWHFGIYASLNGLLLGVFLQSGVLPRPKQLLIWLLVGLESTNLLQPLEGCMLFLVVNAYATSKLFCVVLIH